MSGTSIDALPRPMVVGLVDEGLVDEGLVDDGVVDDGGTELDVVVDVDVELDVVGSDGGGGRGGNSMSPRSGKSSCEQSTGSPVSPSMKPQ